MVVSERATRGGRVLLTWVVLRVVVVVGRAVVVGGGDRRWWWWEGKPVMWPAATNDRIWEDAGRWDRT